jgi:hypothetical protein
VLQIGDAIMSARTRVSGRVGFFAASRFDPGIVWIVSCQSVLARPWGEWPPTERREPIVRVEDAGENARRRTVAFLDNQHVEPDPGVAAALIHSEARVRLDLPDFGRVRAATTPKKGMIVVNVRSGAQPLEGVVVHADEENVEVAPRAGWQRGRRFFAHTDVGAVWFEKSTLAPVMMTTWSRSDGFDDCVGLGVELIQRTLMLEVLRA